MLPAFVVVQSVSHFLLFVTPWTAAHQASLPFTISWSSPKPRFIESVMPYRLVLCRLHLLLPSIFPSTGVFSNELALHIRWPKYWSFSFNISPSSEYSGFISFMIDWFDLLAVQGTQESSPTPQFKSINRVFWFHSSTCSCPIFPAPLIEETAFSPLYIAFSVVD